MFIDNDKFKSPDKKYRANLIVHDWSAWYNGDRTKVMDAINAYGFGGVVTNPNQQNGFFADRENVEDFAKMTAELKERELSYWIYDEQGYPSGKADGRAVIGHPEYEAKGLYMTRRVAYEPRHTTFHIDDETDKIVWAAKYPMEIVDIHDSYVIHDKMEPVPFTDTFCECDLNENEAFFVFCVKSAYEGSACTHNVSSFSRYINIMNYDAVRHFINLAYEPIAAGVPNAYSDAVAVFTDEPALVVGYAREYETWPYALAPWTDGLFEEFEKEYGYSMLPQLPLLFEGGTEAYSIRIKFYRLVGKLIAKAYSGQISDWCKDHGGVFSGHYICEEYLVAQTRTYGNFIEVLKQVGYPGIDLLKCIPERYECNVTKFAHMAVRKNNTNGMMVEVSPFYFKSEFEKAPIENMIGVSNMLFAGGVRKFNSYFRPNLSHYDKDMRSWGYMNEAESNFFNSYIARLSCMLDNAVGKTDTFIYYPVEDAQAKLVPVHVAGMGASESIGIALNNLCDKIYKNGFDYFFADADDLVCAADTIKEGSAKISGMEIKRIIIPSMEVMFSESLEALVALGKAGVDVLFLDKLPNFEVTKDKVCECGERLECFKTYSVEEILNNLKSQNQDFRAICDDVTLLNAKFEKDGKEIRFVINNDREKTANVKVEHQAKSCATLYDPEDGSVSDVNMGDYITISPFRGVFVVFD